MRCGIIVIPMYYIIFILNKRIYWMSISYRGGDAEMKHKSCPKCKGNLIVDSDQYGWYEQCMQCGYLSNLKDMVSAKKSPVKKYEKVL